MTAQTVRRQFTVYDYARMREGGILTEDDRVELLDGEIYLTSPLGPLHIALVNRLNKILMRCVDDQAIVSIQNAVQLDDYSEPQPDIAVLRSRDDEYAQSLARPEDIWLIIEFPIHHSHMIAIRSSHAMRPQMSQKFGLLMLVNT